MVVIALAALSGLLVFKKPDHSLPAAIVTRADRATSQSPPEAPQNGDALRELAATANRLRGGSAIDSARELAWLRSHLDSLGKTAAASAARGYLDSGADALTGLGFKLTAAGQLQEAPTLRLFLMDYLIQADPKVAAAYARRIFVSFGSPDEWAICLRACALGDPTPDGVSYLRQKMRQLLMHEEWRNQPSVGFLEAFDVTVFTRATDLTPDLATCVKQTDNRALAHAAYLTLDRLIQAEPANTLSILQSQPQLLDGREGTRADFFARSDVRDGQQRQILESYLLDPGRSAAEWSAFAGIYPNANYMVSHNLLTQTQTPTGNEIAARDQEALKVTVEWLNDSRFSSHQAELQMVRSRLEGFVHSRSTGK